MKAAVHAFGERAVRRGAVRIPQGKQCQLVLVTFAQRPPPH